MASATATKTVTTPTVGDRVIVVSSKGFEKLAIVTRVHEPKEPKKYPILLDEVREFYAARDLDRETIGGYPESQPEKDETVRLSVQAFGPTGHTCGYQALPPATGAEGEVHVWKPIA